MPLKPELETKWIAGLGESLFDVFTDRKVLGGAPLNVAFHAAQLPLPPSMGVAMISRIGKDAMGDEVMAALSKRGVHTEWMQRDEGHPTGLVQVKMVQGHPQYEIVRDVAWDFLEWNEGLEKLAPRLAAVCFGSLGQRSDLSRSTIRQLLQSSSNAIRLFDINLRPPDVSSSILAEGLELASMVKCNEEELPTLMEILGLEDRLDGSVECLIDTIESIRMLQQWDAFMLTRGPEGCIIASTLGVGMAEPVEATSSPDADPVGAGDATAATLLVGWLKGWSIETIAAAANRIGAFVASSPGQPLLSLLRSSIR